MNVYIVQFEVNDEGEFKSDILGHRFYTDRDEARRAMVRDFDAEKSDCDACDDTDETHDLDHCTLSVNLAWNKVWDVVELTKDEKSDSEKKDMKGFCDTCATVVPLDDDGFCMCCGRRIALEE